MGIFDGHCSEIGKRFKQSEVFLREDVPYRTVVYINRSNNVSVLFRDQRYTHETTDFQVRHAVAFRVSTVFDDVAAKNGLAFVDYIADDRAAKEYCVFQGGSVHVGCRVGNTHVSGNRMTQNDQGSFGLNLLGENIDDFP